MSSRSNYGRKGYNPNFLSQANATAQQALKAESNVNKSVRIRPDYVDRTVSVFSNRGAKVLILWALRSYNFADVKFTYIEDVLDLCKGYLLKHAGRTMNIFQNSELPVNVNADFLNSEGDTLIEKVKEKWEQIPGMLLIKS